jgi:hypothetical protein
MKRYSIFLFSALSIIACTKNPVLPLGGSGTGSGKGNVDDPSSRATALRGAAFSYGSADAALFQGTSGRGSFAGTYDASAPNSTSTTTSQLDAFLPNVTIIPQRPWPFVKNCDPSRYELEKRFVQYIAASDPYRRTIPVRYAISVGTLVDNIAHLAHRRSILRTDATNIVPVPVGPADSLSALSGPTAFHYFADASGAKADLISGSMCYFNIMRVVGEESGQTIKLEDGTFLHENNVMYYGDTDYRTSPEKSPRLFQKLANADYFSAPPQILPLYVADFRSKVPQLDGTTFEILNSEFASSAIRRQEYTESLKNIFNLPNVVRYNDRLVQVLSSNRSVVAKDGYIVVPGTAGATTFSYSAYEGLPQLLRFIVYSGVNATVMSTNYTPIVLDLGKRGILTSSLQWGTFFNATLLQNYAQTDATKRYQVSHQTAWLGGEIEFQNASNNVGPYFKPVAKDGFLVLPNLDGSVTDARNLLGGSTPVTVNGVPRTFANGYQALAALAGKDCASTSTDPKTQYIGPWDTEIFGKLKVWIDSNRNGVSDPGEVIGLADVGVAAINACMLANRTEYDKFGNNTSMRSVFLYMPGEAIYGNEALILQRLAPGFTGAGTAEFRVSIDILFSANTQSYLEKIDPINVGL